MKKPDNRNGIALVVGGLLLAVVVLAMILENLRCK